MSRNRYISQIEFVAAWQGAATVNEAALRLGITHRQATTRAWAMRRMGVPLKPGLRQDGVPTRRVTARKVGPGRPSREVVVLRVMAEALA